MTVFVGLATYVEFVYYPDVSAYTVALWLVVVPMLFAATVRGLRDHPLYQPFVYAGLAAIGVLQYLDGDWYLLAGLFVLAGSAGLVVELRDSDARRRLRPQ